MIADEEAKDTGEANEDLAEPIKLQELARKRGDRKAGMEEARRTEGCGEEEPDHWREGEPPVLICYSPTPDLSGINGSGRIPRRRCYPSVNIYLLGIRGAETPSKT